VTLSAHPLVVIYAAAGGILHFFQLVL